MLSAETAYNTGLMFSPELIREVKYPNIKKIIDALKSCGYKVMFHSDGNKWPILDDIISFGADIIEPCETMATMEVKTLRETYPDTAFASPIDCQVLLAHGTKEDIEAACWQLLEDCGGKKVLTGSTSEIHPEISVENAMTMYNIFRNYHDPEFAAAHKKSLK
jgi:uroporphyrinogen-III decarboxylase